MSIRTTILTILTIATLAACHKDDEPREVEARTVVVYMVAENSLNAFAASDIQEMMAGASAMGPADHLVIYVDDVSMPRIYVLDKNNKVTSYSNLTPQYTYTADMNSADASTLDRVMQYATTHYPASTYGVVFWSHGSGWVPDVTTEAGTTTEADAKQNIKRRKTFGVDNGTNTNSNRGPKMNIDGMAQVLEAYTNIEYLMFDVCLMQTIEVAYELRNTAKYIIGSPAEILAYGAPYNKILQHLFKKPFSPSELISEYYQYYNNSYGYGVVMSAIDTSKFPQFVETTTHLIDQHSWLEADYTDCLDYYQYSWNENPGVITRLPDAYDMKGIMQRVLTPDEMTTWQSSLDQLVVSCYACNSWLTALGRYGAELVELDHEQCSGVSMYLPLEKYSSESFYNEYFKTQWAQLFNIK